MRRTVFVLGGTGYVGRAVVAKLIKERFHPVLLVRPGSEGKIEKNLFTHMSFVRGDARALLQLRDKIATHKPFACIYLIGLLREVPSKNMLYINYHYNWAKDAIDLARELDIKRFLLMSANGAAKGGTGYQRTKYMAEEYLKRSGLAWTIFRPSVIVGNDKLSHFIETVEKLTRFIIVPMPGDGNYRLSPVYRGDVAEIFVKSLREEKTHYKTYHLCGPNAYPYRTLVRLVANVKRRNVVLLPLPLSVTMSLARLLRTDELVQMLVEGNTCKEGAVWQDLNLQQTPFETVLEEYAHPHV